MIRVMGLLRIMRLRPLRQIPMQQHVLYICLMCLTSLMSQVLLISTVLRAQMRGRIFCLDILGGIQMGETKSVPMEQKTAHHRVAQVQRWVFCWRLLLSLWILKSEVSVNLFLDSSSHYYSVSSVALCEISSFYFVAHLQGTIKPFGSGK